MVLVATTRTDEDRGARGHERMNDRWDVGSTVGAESGVRADLRPLPEPRDGAEPAVEGAASRYERRETLGTGGMGRVVVARDRVLERDVALKEVAPRADPGASEALEARIRREARLTARLEHPGIVPVYDAGRRPDGGMFYTMRVIRGRSLADAVRATPDPSARLRLMRHVLDACQAVAWAHRHGVVHRDLKPANIMVGEFGETQVVDWGLARAIDGHEAGLASAADGDDGALTAFGAIVGTPHYMSPEQARGQPADARSDVWALGFVIAEVATGHAVRGTSSAGEALGHARDGKPELALADVPPELAAIARRATALAPAGRYQDAKELADDLAAWLDGRRVGAHVYSTWELVRRLVRAWRVPLAITLLALVAIVAAVAIGFSETAAERDRAEAEEARALAAEARARVALARAEAALGRTLAVEAGVRASFDERPEAELAAATALLHAESPAARGVLASLAAGPRPSRVLTMALPGCLTFMPTADARLGLCVQDGALGAWDLTRGAPVWHRAMRTPAWISPVEGVGALLFEAGSLDSATTGVLDLETGAERARLPYCCAPFQPAPVSAVATSVTPDVVLVARDLTVAPEQVRLPCKASGGVAYDPARGAMFTGCIDGRWIGRTGAGDPREGRIGEGEHATAATFFPGRDELIVGTNKGRVVRLALASGDVVVGARGGVGVVSTVALAPDGRVVAVRDERRGARLWDAVTGAWLGRLPARHDRGARWVDDHPRRLLTWGRDELAAWDVPVGRPRALTVGGGVSALDVGPEGTPWVAVAAGTGVEVLRLDDGARVARYELARIVKGVSFSASGAQVAFGLASYEHAVGVLAPPDETIAWAGERMFTKRLARTAGGWLRAYNWGAFALVTPGGDEVPFDARRSTTDLMLTLDGARGAALVDPAVTLLALALEGAPTVREVARDERWIAAAPANLGDDFACSTTGGVWLVDAYGDVVGWLDARADDELVEVVWSPDDRWVAAAGRSGAVRIWRGADRARVAALAFDPAGRWLASGGWDATLRFTALAPLEVDARALAAELEAAWGVTYDAASEP